MTERRSDGLKRLGIAAWSLLGTILLLGVIGWVLLRFWIIIPPILLAIAIVYVLNPFVTALADRGVARWMVRASRTWSLRGC
jgi:predicted PurR-regulated permease PerM